MIRFVNWRPAMVIKNIETATKTKVEQACILLIEKIKESMGKDKSGIQYPYFPNISSKEGETPAIQTGELSEALEYKIYNEGSQIIARVGINVDQDLGAGKATYLEFGTSKMGERSYLRRTMFLNETEIKKVIG